MKTSDGNRLTTQGMLFLMLSALSGCVLFLGLLYLERGHLGRVEIASAAIALGIACLLLIVLNRVRPKIPQR